MTTTTQRGPVDPIGADLHRTLKALKLGQMSQTLPERLVLARQQKMSHAAFLQVVLAEEVTRRESRSATLRARAAGLDPAMRIDTWDELDDLTYDRERLSDLATLRFTEAGHGVLVLARSASGRPTSHQRWDTSRSDVGSPCTPPAPTSCSPGSAPHGWTTPSTPSSASLPASMSSSSTTSPCGRSTPPRPTTFYELVVERHRKASTIVTSNREPAEWLTMMSDALLAQSAVDRLTSGAHTLVIEGPSYRQRHPQRRADLDPNGGKQ